MKFRYLLTSIALLCLMSCTAQMDDWLMRLYIPIGTTPRKVDLIVYDPDGNPVEGVHISHLNRGYAQCSDASGRIKHKVWTASDEAIIKGQKLEQSCPLARSGTRFYLRKSDVWYETQVRIGAKEAIIVPKNKVKITAKSESWMSPYAEKFRYNNDLFEYYRNKGYSVRESYRRTQKYHN